MGGGNELGMFWKSNFLSYILDKSTCYNFTIFSVKANLYLLYRKGWPVTAQHSQKVEIGSLFT